MKKVLGIALAVVAGLFLLCTFAFGGIYNKLVSADEAVKSAWSQVENVYQRRLDLIPNLVQTVKGYAAHEKETLEAVIEARSKATQIQIHGDQLADPAALEQFQQAQGQLSSALGRLLVVAEQYPDLKANQNFLALQTQLEGTENRITVERMRFNETAKSFNTMIRQFPEVWVANKMQLEKKAYFQAEQGANQAPKVQF